MPAKLLTGKEVAQKLDQDIQKDVQELKAKNVNPALRIMIVGGAEDSVFYANSAKKMAEKNGIICEIEQLPAETSQDEFVNILKQRNADKKINGIIVMRPFPKQSSGGVVNHFLAPEKDVDCFTPVNAGKIMAGDMTGSPPATPQARAAAGMADQTSTRPVASRFMTCIRRQASGGGCKAAACKRSGNGASRIGSNDRENARRSATC